jgi:hypothetical protein
MTEQVFLWSKQKGSFCGINRKDDTVSCEKGDKPYSMGELAKDMEKKEAVEGYAFNLEKIPHDPKNSVYISQGEEGKARRCSTSHVQRGYEFHMDGKHTCSHSNPLQRFNLIHKGGSHGNEFQIEYENNLYTSPLGVEGQEVTGRRRCMIPVGVGCGHSESEAAFELWKWDGKELKPWKDFSK